MGIDIQTAKDHLEMWLEADAAVSKLQSKTIAGRTFTRANANEIRENIDYWQGRLRRLETGGRIRSSVVEL